MTCPWRRCCLTSPGRALPCHALACHWRVTTVTSQRGLQKSVTRERNLCHFPRLKVSRRLKRTFFNQRFAWSLDLFAWTTRKFTGCQYYTTTDRLSDFNGVFLFTSASGIPIILVPLFKTSVSTFSCAEKSNLDTVLSQCETLNDYSTVPSVFFQLL